MHITQYDFTVLLVLSVFASSQLRLSHAALRWYENKKTKCLNPPRTARRVETVIAQCQEEVKNKLVSEAVQILREQMAQNVQQDTMYVGNIYPTALMPPLPEAPTPLSWTGPAETAVKDEETNGDGEVEYTDDDDDDDGAAAYAGTDDVDVGDEETIVGEVITTTEANLPQIFLPTVPAKLRRARKPRLSHRNDRIYTPTLVPLEDKRIAGCLLHCVYAKNNAIDALGWPTLDGLVHFYSEGVSEHGFFMATLRAVNRCLHAVTKRYQVNRRRLPQQGESCDLAFDVFDCISDQITGYCLDEYA